MATDLATLAVRIDASQAKAELGGLEGALGKVGKVAAALGVTLGAASLLKKFVDETSQAQYAVAQLEARLKSTGGVAGQSLAQLQAFSGEMQRLTTYSDEAVQGAQALLLTFTKIRGDVFPGATKAALNLATAMGTDLRGAAIQIGKALQDPEQGLTALRRSGVSFTESQQNVIKSLFATGQEAKAQKLILAELEVQFGGAAEAARNTLGGALEGLQNALGEIFEVTKENTEGLVLLIKMLSDTAKLVAENKALFLGLASAATIAAIGVTKLFTALASTAGILGLLTVGVGAAVVGIYKFFDAEEKLIVAEERDNKLMNEQKRLYGDFSAASMAAARAKKAEADELAKLAAKKADDLAKTKALTESYKEKTAATEREIAYIRTHTDELVKQIEAEQRLAAERKRIEDEADARATKRVIKGATGSAVGIFAGGTPGGTGITESFGKTPGVTSELAKQAGARAFAIAEEEGRKRAEALIAAEEKIEAEKAKLRENFMRQFQQTVANGISDMLTKGLNSWRDFFANLKQMFLKLVADFAAAKIMDKMLGTSTAGATSLGSFFGMGKGGAPGAGAGYAGTVLASAGVGYGLGKSIGGAKGVAAGALGGAATGAMIGSVVPVIGTAVGAVVGGIAGFVGGLFGASKAAKEAAARQRELAEQTRLAAEQAAREAEERRRAREEASRILMEDLAIRRLRAQGLEEEADALALATQQAREFAEAVKAGLSPEVLAELARTQGLETKRREDDLAARRAEEAARRSAEAAGAMPDPSGVVATRQLSTVTSGQGDRMVDELRSSRIHLSNIDRFVRIIADNTGGLRQFSRTVDHALSNALANASTFSGNGLVMA